MKQVTWRELRDVCKLATRSGLSAAYVSIVERGGNVPSLTTILELIEVLGGDLSEVMRELAAARNRPAG